MIIGNEAGYSLTSPSTTNIAIGKRALYSNQTGYWNVAIGENALFNMTATGDNGSVAIGPYALFQNTTGTFNMAFGRQTLASNQTGSGNIAIGFRAMYSGTSPSSNIAIGNSAGSSNSGSGNIFLGHSAGSSEAGSNKLYIENSSSSSPLIWGDFENNILNFNGSVGIGTTAPTTALEVAGTVYSTSGGFKLPDETVIADAGDLGKWSGDTNIYYTGGSVGIGTTSPYNSLHVIQSSSSTNVGTSPWAGAVIQNTDTTDGNMSSLHFLNSADADSAAIIAKHVNATATQGGGASGRLYFMTNNNWTYARMVIDENGKVGIGSSVSSFTPQSRLDVNGNVSIGSYAGTSAAPTNGLIVSGNVGIGTTAPASSLSIGTNSSTLLSDGADSVLAGGLNISLATGVGYVAGFANPANAGADDRHGVLIAAGRSDGDSNILNLSNNDGGSISTKFQFESDGDAIWPATSGLFTIGSSNKVSRLSLGGTSISDGTTSVNSKGLSVYMSGTSGYAAAIQNYASGGSTDHNGLLVKGGGVILQPMR